MHKCLKKMISHRYLTKIHTNMFGQKYTNVKRYEEKNLYIATKISEKYYMTRKQIQENITNYETKKYKQMNITQLVSQNKS